MASISSQVYAPAEDSFLLEREILKKNLAGKVCLDLGTGSGIQALAMLKAGADFIVCADINPLALKKSKETVEAYLKENKVQFLGQIWFMESDLFSNLKGVKFDFIAFNPPYVPSDEIKWVDLDGGKKGRETIDRFLSQFIGHLSRDGEVLLLISSLNAPQEIIQTLKKHNFSVKEISSQKLFFEELKVLEMARL